MADEKLTNVAIVAIVAIVVIGVLVASGFTTTGYALRGPSADSTNNCFDEAKQMHAFCIKMGWDGVICGNWLNQDMARCQHKIRGLLP